MDTKKLLVGQDAYIVSGVYVGKGKGKVVKVWETPHPVYPGTVVEVQMSDELMHFDRNGVACDGKGTYECGLWELDFRPREGD